MCFDKFETMQNRPAPRMQARGFSLMEMLLVLVIISLLAGIMGISAKSYVDRSRVRKAGADLSMLHTNLNAYYMDHGQYPTMNEGLAVLAPDYIEHVGKDPWGRDYQYEVPGRDKDPFEVICLRRDGQEGGDGVDADITNWSIIQGQDNNEDSGS